MVDTLGRLRTTGRVMIRALSQGPLRPHPSQWRLASFSLPGPSTCLPEAPRPASHVTLARKVSKHHLLGVSSLMAWTRESLALDMAV